jgi:hypothetical protein
MPMELLCGGGVESRPGRRSRWVAPVLCAAALLGCTTARDMAASPEAEPTLVALMADGPLAAEMMGGPVGPCST